MPDKRLQYLFDRYMNNACSQAEEEELAVLSILKGNDEKIKGLLETYWERPGSGEDMSAEKSELLLHRILNTSSRQLTHEPAKIKKIGWHRWVAAAAVLLIAGLSGYFFFFNKAEKPIKETAITQPVDNDVEAPKITRATITLADGGTVGVDSLTALTQNNVNLVKAADGKIVYSGNTTEVIYNTLTNPRGSKVVDMQLSDGSHVWLNAGSSVTYPVAFVGNERKVSITGEAYFEIVHDKTKPFRVRNGDATIEVLGTHFNVNAFDDEADIKVTLLEGSVKVSNAQNSLTIQPDQQAVISTNDISLNTHVEMQEVTAWINGKFIFSDKKDLKTIMREIARWYDIEVVYEGNIMDQKFGGEFPRNTKLSEVLEILQTSGVKFTIEERKVIIR